MSEVIVTIMQPAYLPWIGFFDRIAASDLFICLDHVRIDHNTKTSFSNRNRIRTQQGWTWLTVPILTSGRSSELQIDGIEIADDRWRVKHWRAIEQSYSKAPYFREHRETFAALFSREWPMLTGLCDALTELLLQAFDITTPIVHSRTMKSRSEKDQLVMDLCREVGASAYISGPFGREYLQAEAFRDANIALYFHDYPHPVYSQAYPGFEPYMSALDLLFNHGPNARLIMTSNHGLVPA